MRENGTCYAGEDKAREYGNGEDILGDLLVSGRVGEPKDDMLDLVVDSSTSLESFGLRIRREIVKIGLEKPECLASDISIIKRFGRAGGLN
jgi:hypothetical protein